jgi:hypothetical protein
LSSLPMRWKEASLSCGRVTNLRRRGSVCDTCALKQQARRATGNRVSPRGCLTPRAATTGAKDSQPSTHTDAAPSPLQQTHPHPQPLTMRCWGRSVTV